MLSYILLASFAIIEKLGAVWEMGIEVFVDSAFHTDANPDSTSCVDVDPGTERNVVDMMPLPTFNLCAGILEQSLSYRRASLHKLSETNPGNRLLCS